MTQQTSDSILCTDIEHLKTIVLVPKSASDHPYLVTNETLCCNTVTVTVGRERHGQTRGPDGHGPRGGRQGQERVVRVPSPGRRREGAPAPTANAARRTEEAGAAADPQGSERKTRGKATRTRNATPVVPDPGADAAATETTEGRTA